jgi:diketogulonate reductase-like aldo/keto reductase
MESITLNNGTQIPSAGIGTFLLQPAEAEAAVLSALQNGYTLVDTANAYLNEKAVGRAMKASGRAREEIYLSTKLWPSVYATADQAIDETLARLDTDYVDLLFLHQPVGDYVGAYQAMERAVQAGKVKSLGLSNFSQAQIQEILDVAAIRPAVLQVEAHPYFPQTQLKTFLASFGAVVMAWYPLGHGDKALLEEPVLTQLAQKYSKTPAQVLLRWHTQVGNIVIPGSKNEDHIKDNIALYDFTLAPQDLAAIAALDKNTPYYVASDEALQGYLAFAPNFDAQD